jgi:hypothetical protein
MIALSEEKQMFVLVGLSLNEDLGFFDFGAGRVNDSYVLGFQIS